MDEKKQVSYYAIIPANVRYDKEISANAKLLYGEITALCNAKGYCWATNQYFANLYSVSKKTVSRWISELADKGYINSYMQYKDGSREVDQRVVSINNTTDKKVDTYTQKDRYPIPKNVNTPIPKNVHTPIPKNAEDNTTSINTTSINNTRKNNTKRAEPFADYTSNSLLSDAIKDFISMRKQIKAPMTDRAIKLMLQKLDTLAQNDDTKIAVLNQSILNSWKGIFPIKEEKRHDRFSARDDGEESIDWSAFDGA